MLIALSPLVLLLLQVLRLPIRVPLGMRRRAMLLFAARSSLRLQLPAAQLRLMSRTLSPLVLLVLLLLRLPTLASLTRAAVELTLFAAAPAAPPELALARATFAVGDGCAAAGGVARRALRG